MDPPGASAQTTASRVLLDSTNTRSAHRLIHFAKNAGKQHAMVERLFRAYFPDGLNSCDHDVLADLAGEIGLDRAATHETLDSGAFGADFEANVRGGP